MHRTESGIVVVTDVDGVIADSQRENIDLFNSRFNQEFKYADWAEFTTLFNLAIKLSGEDPSVIAAWLFSNEVMAKAKPIKGSQENIAKLVELGIVPEAATSRPPSQTKVTNNWIEKHFPDISEIHLRNENSQIDGRSFKVARVEIAKADVYIDDDLRMINVIAQQIAQGNLSYLKYLLLVDRPWNQGELPPQATRVGNWREENYGWDEIFDITTRSL